MNMLTDLTPAQQTARDIWTSGNYAEVADRLIRGFGPVLVQELDIQRGLKVLDVGLRRRQRRNPRCPGGRRGHRPRHHARAARARRDAGGGLRV